MDYSHIRIMSLMQAKMAYNAANQDVLAQNIANADTPGYRAMQLKKVDFEGLAMDHAHKLQLMTTTSGQIGHANGPSGDWDTAKQKKTFETKTVKNNVSLEEQMAMVSMNNADYTMVTDLYKKTAGMFKTALGPR